VDLKPYSVVGWMAGLHSVSDITSTFLFLRFYLRQHTEKCALLFMSPALPWKSNIKQS